MKKYSVRIIALLTAVVTMLSSFTPPARAASLMDFIQVSVEDWVAGWSGNNTGVWNPVDPLAGIFTANREQKYYTTPTSSEEDQYGNVTNYYRGGDTTTTKILDSYNQTFNTIHNTTNNTNNYSANVKLSDFLNSYTTNTNNYTYNTKYNSWYYDNTQNTINYDASQTYYNTDNSRYYISIDNSTDEYYLVNVQYSPTFVTVNYTYNNIDNSVTNNYGDVTNVYYFELTDGRNSADLTADEVAGLDLGYDVANYQLVTDDPNTLSLQHFDGDYTDSSAYGREFYSENRSSSYVDTGSFLQAVALDDGSAAGITVPGLWSHNAFSIEFRTYQTAASSGTNQLAVYSGNVPLLSYGISNKFYVRDSSWGVVSTEVAKSVMAQTRLGMAATKPVDGYIIAESTGSSTAYNGYFAFYDTDWVADSSNWYTVSFHKIKEGYSFHYGEWNSWKIVVNGNNYYWFLNGDLLSSTTHDRLADDTLYIYAGGTLYLDELRISTGDMVSTEAYTPSSAPFDTNKVLALPTELTADTIYVRHSTPVTAWRIGGVRPSNPTTGFFYIPLHSDYTGGQSQLYDGSNWVDVDSVVYDGSTTQNTLGFTFSPIGNSTDVDPDLEPGRPEDKPDQSTCTHTWEETSRIDATCTAVGSVEYTCSICDATKSETIAKLSHTWEVKETVDDTLDEEGNVVTEGYTLYYCTVCNEEYKDTDGSGPPTGDSDDGNWFETLLNNIAEFFGTTIGGLLELVGTVINKVLDSLISLVSTTIEKLGQIVDLFGSFGDALSSLWTWLPADILTVLSAGVTVIIFLAVIKIFLK